MPTSHSPPRVLYGNTGEFIAFVSAGITPMQLAMANKWQYGLSDIAHLLDKVIGLSRELSKDPVVLLTLSVNEQLVLILNHSTDGISTCAVIGDPEKAFISFTSDEENSLIHYADLRVDIDGTSMYVVDSFSRGSTLTEVIAMNEYANQQLAGLL